jgi:cytoskeletal protein RodZ
MFLFYWALLALMNLVGLFFLVFLIVFQAPQQNNSRLQDNSDTSNQGNKPKTTSQRGPPTDKESLQSKDISIKSDEETGAEESPCSIVIFCCEEAGVLDASATAVSSSLLIEISFDCSDSLSVIHSIRGQ